jgi:hypothetical protein
MRFAARHLISKQIRYSPPGSVGGPMRSYPVYESNIEPYLRFFHERNLVPGGWIVAEKTEKVRLLASTCEIDRQVSYEKVSPSECLIDAPFVVASFDLECLSLGGDFPVAKKDYKQISQVLFDANASWMSQSDYTRRTRITGLLSRCFGIDDGEIRDPEVDKVDVPKTSMKVQVLLKKVPSKSYAGSS